MVYIICNNANIEQSYTQAISTEVEKYLHSTSLINKSDSLKSISIIINPQLKTYSNYHKLTPKVYWAYADENIKIESKAWNLFKLHCINLHPLLKGGIDNVLLVLNAQENKYNQPQAEQKKPSDDNGEKGNDEEKNTSYTAVTPKYTLDKVILNKDAEEQIKRALTLIRSRKRIFNEWGFSEIDPHTKSIICFFGQPGTGKTMCAHAMATELGKKILIASYASIESKYVGEGPKNLRKIFKDAEEQDAILFFDEADSFLSKRVASAETSSDKHYNRMSNEMFQLLEDYNGVIIFATNLVSDFDKAFKSRILAFVEFKMPDKDTRKELIIKHTPSKLPLKSPLTDKEIDKLADISEGFSGRDIRKAMLTTLTEGATKNISLFTFHEFEVGFKAIKEEAEAIQNSAHEEGKSNTIADFIKQDTINKAIYNLALKAAFQGNELSGKLRVELFNLSKILNLGDPDLSINYKDKDINHDCETIIEGGSADDAMRYLCNMLALTSITNDSKAEYVAEMASKLKVKAVDTYIQYIDIIEKVGNCNKNNNIN